MRRILAALAVPMALTAIALSPLAALADVSLGDPVFAPLRANIEISELRIQKSGSGAAFMLLAVKNTGYVSTGSFTVSDFVQGPGGMLRPWPSTRTVADLAPGESRTLEYPLYQLTPPSLELQSWWLYVRVNFPQTVTESNYNDNIAMRWMGA